MITWLLAFVPGLVLSGTGNSSVHTPHAECSGVALGTLANGDTEIVLASRNETNILRSVDDGLTWQVVTGDGIEQAFPTRVVWYPNGSESEYLISTDQGLYTYSSATGTIHLNSDGIPEAERNIVDVAVPRAGHDGPALCVNNMGAVYLYDRPSETWSKVLDLGVEDFNAVVAVTPDYDAAVAVGRQRAMAVGVNGVMYTSNNGGTAWGVQNQFQVPAMSELDWHITAIAYADDFISSGEMLVGRGREQPSNFSEDEGDLWRSTDGGLNFVPTSVLGQATTYSSITNLECGPLGPGGDLVWYLSFLFFAEVIQPDSIGILMSRDGGLTWSDEGNTQDFLQEAQQNDRTAVGREYRGMTSFAFDPNYTTNGRVWQARAEGVYVTPDEGTHWERRQLRPAKQVRGVGVGIDGAGDYFAYAATYGSANILVNITKSEAEWLPGSDMAFQLPAVVSRTAHQDGVLISGGQSDVSVLVQDPAPINMQGRYSINNIHDKVVGGTGYVRTLELSPNFSATGATGTDGVAIWSARLKDSTRGNNRMTLDTFQSVHVLDKVEGFPAKQPPWFKGMSISPTFDAVNLPRTLEVFGADFRGEAVWHLLNNGTALAPVFEWRPVDWFPEIRMQDVQVDPRFARPGFPVIWALTKEGLYRIEDLSDDWRTVKVDAYAKLDNLPLDLELPPDMASNPAAFVMTWGGGLQKLDLSVPGQSWQEVGVGFPDEWGNCLDFAPDFETSRLIVVGGQNGMLAGRDVPGVAWERLPMDYAIDNTNPGIGYFDPNNLANPDPERRFGWEFFSKNDLPKGLKKRLDFFGGDVALTESDGSYLEFPLRGESFAVLCAEGPNQGSINIEVFDFLTGALVTSVQRDLNKGVYGMTQVPVPIAAPMAMRIRVTVSLDADESFGFDGFRLQEL